MLLLDNSAWARLMQRAIPHDRSTAIQEHFRHGEIGVSMPFLLEAGYSARSSADHERMMSRLERLPWVPIDGETERLALRAQRELAEVGHHRLPPVDVMIAACAHRAEAGVLHYDGDYDVLAERTSLRFHSEWIVPAGSL